MREVVLWWSKDRVLKPMAMAEWNNGKEFFIGVSHQNQIDQLIHMIDVRFDEFTLTLIQSGLMIEELNHTGSCTERFIFISDRLPPYTARCHWWILRAIRMILMIDHFNCLNQKSSGPSKRVSMMSMMRSRHVLLPYRNEPNWVTQTRVRIWISSIKLVQFDWFGLDLIRFKKIMLAYDWA